MGSIKKLLYGFNLRERLNIYAGALISVAIPIPVVRYGIFNDIRDDSILSSVGAWGLSFVCVLPILIPAGFAGLALGYFEARRLRGNRLEKENRLEKVVGE